MLYLYDIILYNNITLYKFITNSYTHQEATACGIPHRKLVYLRKLWVWGGNHVPPVQLKL